MTETGQLREPKKWKLSPSQSTVYISNLPFSLTNNDLHKILEKYGKVVRVTIMNDKVTRKSKGVAFVLFLGTNEARDCVSDLNGKKMFDRTIKCSIASDNGRCSEFIRKRYYTDKSMCYQCGQLGHLSYNCEKNTLGSREPPPKKIRKKRKKIDLETANDGNSNDESDEDSFNESRLQAESLETLSAVIADDYEHRKYEEQTPGVCIPSAAFSKRPKYKKSSYLSDDEEISDD